MSILSPDPAVVWALLHSLWQSTLVAALSWATLKPIPARHPGIRYWLALASLAAMLLAFAFTWHHLSQPTPAPQPISQSITSPPTNAPSPAPSSPAQSPIAPQSDPAIAAAVSSAPTPTITSHQSTPPAPSSFQEIAVHLTPLLPWLSSLYLLGVAAMLVRLFMALLRAFLIRRAASPITFGHEFDLFNQLTPHFTLPWAPWTRARLALSHHIRVPSVIGWLYPIVLLPARGLSTLSPEDLKPILAHELAHARRMDALVNLLQSLAESFLFFNPAIWWVSRVIRQEREACCDAIALQLADTSPRAYASALYNWGQMTASAGPEPQLALTGPTNSSNGRLKLLDRVNRLLRPDASPQLSTPAASLLLLTLFAATLLITITPNLANEKPAYTPDPNTPPNIFFYDIRDLIDARWKMRLTSNQIAQHLIDTVATPDYWSTDNLGQTQGSIVDLWGSRLDIKAPEQTQLLVQAALSQLRARQDQAQKEAHLPLPSREGLFVQPADFVPKGQADTFTPAQQSAALTRINRLQAQYAPLMNDAQEYTVKIQVRIARIGPDSQKPLPPQATILIGHRTGFLSSNTSSRIPSADGVFTLQVPIGVYSITGYIPGHSAQTLGPFWAGPNDTPPVAILTFTPNTQRRLNFVDTDNRPVTPGPLRLGPLLTPTREGNRYAFPLEEAFASSPSIDFPLPPSGRYSIQPTAPGFIGSDTLFNIPPGNDPITVTLYKSPVAAGRILDADTNRPIPNASITLSKSTLPWSTRVPATVQSNPDGTFLYSSFDANLYNDRPIYHDDFPVPLWVTAPGYASLPLLAVPSFEKPTPIRVLKGNTASEITSPTGPPVPVDLKLPREVTRDIHITGDLTRLPGYPQAPVIILQIQTLNGPNQREIVHVLKLPVSIKGGMASARIHGLSRLTRAEIFIPGLSALRTTIDLDDTTPIRWTLPKATDKRQVKIRVFGLTADELKSAHLVARHEVPGMPSHPGPQPAPDDQNIQSLSLPLTFDDHGTATLDLPLLCSVYLDCPGFNGQPWNGAFHVTPGTNALHVNQFVAPIRAKGAIFGRVIDAQSKPVTESQVGLWDQGTWPGASLRSLPVTSNGFAFMDLPIHAKDAYYFNLTLPSTLDQSISVTSAAILTSENPVQEVVIQLSPDGKSAKLIPQTQSAPITKPVVAP